MDRSAPGLKWATWNRHVDSEMQCGYLVFKAENNVQNSVICSDGCSLCFLQLQMYILCMFFCGLLRIVILSQENLNML